MEASEVTRETVTESTEDNKVTSENNAETPTETKYTKETQSKTPEKSKVKNPAKQVGIEEIKQTEFKLPTFISTEGNILTDFAKSVVDSYVRILDNVRTYLQVHGLKIIITDNDLAKKFYPNGEYTSIQGLTLFKDKTVWLENQSTVHQEAVIHECGHLLDDSFGRLSRTDEWIGIYNAEKDSATNIMKNHTTSSGLEYFAESFQLYVLNAEQLKKTLHQTYEYLNKLVTSIK